MGKNEAAEKVEISKKMLDQITKGLERLQKELGRLRKGMKSKDER